MSKGNKPFQPAPTPPAEVNSTDAVQAEIRDAVKSIAADIAWFRDKAERSNAFGR